MEMIKTFKVYDGSIERWETCISLNAKEELNLLEKWGDAYSDQDLVESKIKELKDKRR